MRWAKRFQVVVCRCLAVSYAAAPHLSWLHGFERVLCKVLLACWALVANVQGVDDVIEQWHVQVAMLCPMKLRRTRPEYTDLSITCAKYSCTGEILASYSDEVTFPLFLYTLLAAIALYSEVVTFPGTILCVSCQHCLLYR